MKNIFLIIFLVVGISANAQVATDALRYSVLDVGGTARTVGVGGALGALGADYSVLSTNPAGLANFRTSELVMTPSMHLASTKATLTNGNNTSNKATNNRFNFNNIGFVFHTQPRRDKWSTFNWGIGLNRLASYNQELFFEGTSEGSIVQRFTELANDNLFDQFEVDLANEALAIYDDDGDEIWNNDFEFKPGFVTKREQLVKTSGAYNEVVISMATNYDEKLMIGATLGLPFISFEEEKFYKEEDVDDVPFFDNLEFQEFVSTSGIGVNLKVGLIYRLNQMFRFGIAAHSPTRFALTDNFTTQLTYAFTDGAGSQTNTQDSPRGSFDYGLKTPWRVIGSAAVLINRKGFISTDIELIDYSLSEFNLTKNTTDPVEEAYEREVNTDISRLFTQAINFRIGGEYAMDIFRFRAGFNISGTSYAEDNITNKGYSIGAGVRKNSFYLDLAFKNSNRTESYVPYLMADPANEQFVNTEISNNQVFMTLGVKW